MKFREKAREIYEHGVEERSNFTPSGVPLRMFNYWLQYSDGVKAQRIRGGKKENFCHYWRVVFLWAPLWFIGRNILHFVDKYVATKTGIAVVLAMYLALSALLILAGGVVGGVLMVAIPYALLGIVAGLVLTEPDYNSHWKYVAIAAPTSGIVLGGKWVKDHWNHNWDEPIAKAVFFILVSIAVGVAALGIYVLIMQLGILGFLLLAAAILTGAGIIFAVCWTIVSLIEGLRNRNRHHWQEILSEYDERGEAYPADFKVRHSRWRRFWTGVADFFVLLAQVVRVKKWKICPIVEVDTDRRS